MSAAPLATPSEEFPRLDTIPDKDDGDDAYGAPTVVGAMSPELIRSVMADADDAPPPRSSPPPARVSEVRALFVRAAHPQAAKRSQPPPNPHLIPRLFDDEADEQLDPSLLFGPKQSGTTIVIDTRSVMSVIDGLERIDVAPYPDAHPLAAIEPGAPARRPPWTGAELAIMAFSFLVVAVPALYVLFSELF